MGQPEVDTRALADSIREEPAQLEEFSEKNPAVLGMLDTVYPELVRAPESKLRTALTALPAAPAHDNDFRQLVNLTFGTLEARPGLHSKFEFRLTLKDVEPGKTQERLGFLVSQMNVKIRRMQNYPSNGFDVGLSRNDDLPKFKQAGNVVFICSSLIHDSFNRHRTETVKVNGEERISQEALLSMHGLVEVPNDVVRAVVGMFRLAKEFPGNETDIGTERDQGDVFEGKYARTKQGSDSGCVMSKLCGVTDHDWTGGLSADFYFGVVGGISPYLK